MFRYLLRGAEYRILEIDTEIDEELIDEGFNGVLTVEPVGVGAT